MPTLALADALPDFGVAKAPAARPNAGMSPSATSPATAPQSRSDEREARKAADAVAKAEAEVAERLQHEYEEKLSAERQRHKQEIEELQEQLGKNAAETIAARFAGMERQTIDLTSALVARILGVTLSEELQNRAVEHLSRIIAETLTDREAVRISVYGTGFLCEQLRTMLGERSAQVDFVETPGLDLSIHIDESILETRLTEWSEALSEVLS
ncbi:hypothetical protein [Chelativorans sp. YIM 93263]|uniref:hypothetical protein n=1 Tax=Chelativorans sp. YIM 93263 TaxID=2906648 RepID=UPI0023792571|nr:hypothetical protein [Chelativorans sp. YIM 93263]